MKNNLLISLVGLMVSAAGYVLSGLNPGYITMFIGGFVSIIGIVIAVWALPSKSLEETMDDNWIAEELEKREKEIGNEVNDALNYQIARHNEALDLESKRVTEYDEVWYDAKNDALFLVKDWTTEVDFDQPSRFIYVGPL